MVCDVCSDKYYIITNNIEGDAIVAKCDFCNKFESDFDVWLYLFPLKEYYSEGRLEELKQILKDNYTEVMKNG